MKGLLHADIFLGNAICYSMHSAQSLALHHRALVVIATAQDHLLKQKKNQE